MGILETNNLSKGLVACSFKVGGAEKSLNFPFLTPEEKPKCFRCGSGSRLDRYYPRPGESLADAGRVVNVCSKRDCGQFMSFADELGNNPYTPFCNCGKFSFRVVAQRDDGSHFIYYRCAKDENPCDFYDEYPWTVTQTDLMKSGYVRSFADLKL